jgi:transposase
MQITMIGLDLAKSVFQVHGVDATGQVVVRKSLRRSQMLPFFAKLPPCLVGIEACGTSHHWARELIKLGHEVRLMPPAYVKPYVKRGKTDAADAEAVCEAVTRPTMRFVPVKSPEQQAALSMHRTRDLLVKQRTQLINMIRGLLAEFGIDIPKRLLTPSCGGSPLPRREQWARQGRSLGSLTPRPGIREQYLPTAEVAVS